MGITQASFFRDANFDPITAIGFQASKTITYATATTGATGATTLFTVTGDVEVSVFAICTADLTGLAATVEIGIVGNTASIIAQTTATNITSGKWWATTSPSTVLATPASKLLHATNISQLIATHSVDAGSLTYYCLWFPVSSDGLVVAA